MLKDLRHTVKHIVIYSFGNLSTKLIGFVLLPLYTDNLTTSEYGMLAILEVTSFMLIASVGMRLSTAMMRWVSAEKDSKKLKSIVFTTLVSLLIVSIIFNIIFQPLTGYFARILFDSNRFENYFKVLFLFVSFEIFNVWVLDLIRIKGKPIFFVILSIVKFTVLLSLNIYFIKYRGLGVLGIILSQLIGSIILFLLSIPFMFKNVILKIAYEEIKPMFKYSFPLIFSSISMYLLSLGDRYLMKQMLDLGDVGIYSLGYKIATVTNLIVIQSFQTGFLPIAFNKYGTEGSDRFFVKSLTYYAFILVIVSLGLSMMSKELIMLLSRSDEYLTVYKIVPFISLALVFKGIQFMFSLSLQFVKETKYNALIVLFAAVFNLMLNYFLLPFLGIYGAGIASVISFFLMFLFFLFFSKKFYDPGYEVGKLFILIIVGIGLYFISILFNDFNMIVSILLKLILLLSFPVVLFLFGFYEKIEIERIKGFLKKWRHSSKWITNIKQLIKS